MDDTAELEKLRAVIRDEVAFIMDRFTLDKRAVEALGRIEKAAGIESPISGLPERKAE